MSVKLWSVDVNIYVFVYKLVQKDVQGLSETVYIMEDDSLTQK